MKLYDYPPSGNSYKVRLTAATLGLPFTIVPIDIHKGDTHTADYLAKNPAGQIPLLELDDGRVLAESNAIIHYLAQDSHLIPDDEFQRAKMLQWMFWEQYRHEPAIAVARFIRMYQPDGREAELPALTAKGHAALTVMEDHLGDTGWMVGDALTLADISLYAYTHVAGDGGFDLTDYPNVQAWLARVANAPGHKPMNWLPD